MAGRVGLFVAAAAVGAGIAFAVVFMRQEPPPPADGIPLELAETRAARVSDLRYDATFTIPAARAEQVTGHVTVSFTLRDTDAPLALDFAQADDHLRAVAANGRAVPPQIINQHVVIPARDLIAGENTIELDFIAGDEALNRQDEFLYTLFVPARAALAMPVFDQPNLKGRWRLTLNLPPDWTAVANGAETGRLTADDHIGVFFEETEPLPTYLVAFAAGRFAVEVAERDGRAFRMFHRETDAAKVERNLDSIIDLHANALAWLENYTGIAYPFAKFEFVLIPSFQFGGMEHPGAVFYRADSLLLDESATQAQMLGRANLISHETAHMWFGDLVTMAWFDDVWMKEVFANFMAAKIVNPAFPGVNHELRFLLQNYPAAYDVDRTDGSNPIRQPLANLNQAGSLYGAIIYQKAPIVMRQLELLLGAEAFRDGLRQYLADHAFGNATWQDLIAIFDDMTADDLAAWSQAWVEEPGRPTIRTRLDVRDDRVSRLAFGQEDPRNRNLVWPERLQVVVGWRERTERFDLTLGAGDSIVVAAAGLAAPDWVLPVGGGLGYGFFDLDLRTLDSLTASLHQIGDPVDRGAALVALWEAMLEGRVPPGRVLDALMRALPRETDELLLQRLLGYTDQAFWQFTAADDRGRIGTQLDSILRAGLSRAASTSEKAAWFNALRSMATSDSVVAWLEQVWRGAITIGGLPLSENDLSGLAMDLAVRDVALADDILRTQHERIDNRDRWERFAFIMPALSSDVSVRDAFFSTLRDVQNRQREAWVLDAAEYLHHPLRASTSRRYVTSALDLVLDIQRTGDIFFPKRWADATLSGYQSVQTAADVREFINALPDDYPPRLRWVLLSAGDPLFRAARLLN